MDSDSLVATRVDSYLARARATSDRYQKAAILSEAAAYVGRQIEGRPGWDTFTYRWFNNAAAIVAPATHPGAANFLKGQVYKYNEVAAKAWANRHLNWYEQQDASNLIVDGNLTRVVTALRGGARATTAIIADADASIGRTLLDVPIWGGTGARGYFGLDAAPSDIAQWFQWQTIAARDHLLDRSEYELYDRRIKVITSGIAQTIYERIYVDSVAGRPTDYCFAAGTMVTMADGGERPIEKVRVGHLVASFDQLGSLVAKPVTAVHKSVAPETIETPWGTRVTPEHQYLTVDGTFRAIGDALVRGDTLVDSHGRGVPFTSYGRLPQKLMKEKSLVFNITVADLHTYVADGFRVHNDSLFKFLDGTETILAYKDEGGKQELLAVKPDGSLVELAGETNTNGRTDLLRRAENFPGNQEGDTRVIHTYTSFGAFGKPVGKPKIDVAFDGKIVPFADVTGTFASTLSRHFIGGGLGGQVASSLIGVAASNLGQAIQIWADEVNIFGDGTAPSLEDAIDSAYGSFGRDLYAAGVGAVSTYLTAELISELGIRGFAGELTNTVAGSIVSKVATNIALGTTNPFAGIGSATFLPAAVGSFLGTKLASFVHSFDSVGGQIGSSIGGALGAIAGAKLLTVVLVDVAGKVLGNLLAPGIGAFVGALAGGLLGSLLAGGGTPESGAHLAWNHATQRYDIATSRSWSDDGASPDTATYMATYARDVLNTLVDTLRINNAGALINPTRAEQGAWGQRNTEYIYWGNGENSENHIDSNRSSNVNDAINHGLDLNISRLTFVGGNLFTCRGLYGHLAKSGTSTQFDYSAMFGDIAIAGDYATYARNSGLINEAILADPDSQFSAGWLATLQRANELGVDEFFRSDFYGGLTSFIEGATSGAAGRGSGLAMSDFGFHGQAPVGVADVIGWQSGQHTAETRWSTVAGPDGLPTVAMETGQAAPYNEAGGGAVTNQFTIDPTKAYEFTIYVRKKDLTKHGLYFGLSAFGASAYVERLDGVDEINPYFYAATAATQQTTLNADKWYKVVGYVLPQGVSASPVLAQSGVFDATTGTKVADVANFRWNPERPGNSVHARFFNFYDHTQAGWSTLWLPPQVRAVGGGVGKGPNLVDTSGWAEREFRDVHIPGDVAPADVGVRFTTDAGVDLRISVAGGDPPPGSAVVDGWNGTAPDLAEEARWTPVTGPDGMPAVAMETGQTGSVDDPGGGALTNAITIDGTKAYEFTIYLRKHDLAKHSAFFGLSGGGYVQLLGGAVDANPYFYAATASQQRAQGLKDDRWYKVVGYVLPQGATSSPLTTASGVFDAVSGVKVADVTNFRWNPARPGNAVHARFFNFYDASQAGYSTHWLPPQVRAVEGGVATGPNLVDTSGWATINPQDIVIPNFAATMGYAESGYVSGTVTGSVYSDLLIASGSSRVVFSDSTAATSANGPNVRGASTLSDDIFVGGVGNDELYGRAGWDWLDAGPGDDFVDGGDGNDVLLGRAGWDRLFGQAGDDQLDGGDGYDLSGVGESELLYGGDGDDTFFTTPDDGPDFLDGGAGVDVVSYRRSLSAVSLTAGGVVYNDTFVGIEGVEGSRFNDSLTAVAAGSRLLGGDGADILQGGAGADILEGGAGADTIAGAAGSDTASYASSNAGVNIDLVNGVHSGGHATGDVLSAIENVTGSSFADVIRGQLQSRVDAGRGNDLVMSSGSGNVDGGDGVDTVSYIYANSAVTANIGTGIGTDTLKSVEIVVGSGYNDTLTGSDVDDRLDGGSGGVDTLTGLSGDDTYALSRTTGSDDVFDYYGGTQLNSYKDGVVLGQGVKAGEGHLWRPNNDSSLLKAGALDSINGGVSWLNLNSFYTGNAYKIERMYWENGAFVWISGITKTFGGASGNDTVDGQTGQNNWLAGQEGADTLNGKESNDVLVGGAGVFNDLLNGRSGSDQYVFGRDEGRDIINDSSGIDTLVIAGDVRADEVTFEFVGADLYVGIANPGATATTASQSLTYVKIVGQANQATSIENIRIGDFETNLAKLVGQTTGYSSVPQAPTITKNIQARFTTGHLGTIAAYDADGDALTYEVIAVTGDGPAVFTSATDNNIRTEGSNLVTTARWTTQDYELDTVTIRARDDDNNVITYDVQINWLPDPNGGPVLPIVFDLDGDGVELASPKQSGVEWDINEDGRDDKMGWVKPDDAFLVYDRNKSGTIDNIEELSFAGDREGALTDLGGLAGLDLDRNDVADGKIDSNDLVYAHLSVWRDANGNGFSEATELRTLAEAGIASINLTGTPTGNDPRDRKNVVINTGSFIWTDGRQGGFGDVSLGVIYGKPANDPTTDAETRANGREIDRLLKGGVRNRRGGSGAPSGTSGTVSPIVFDLGGDGIALITIAASTLDLDVDGDGDLDRTGWVAPDDAMLVYDENANGVVDGTSEISMVRHLEGAATDLEGLRAFDSNANGELDPEDAEFDRFLLWRDGDSDGHSSEGELVSLRTAGLSRLLFAATPDGDRFGGNVVHGTTSFELSDGTRGMVGDVALGYIETSPESPETTYPAPPSDVSAPADDGEPLGEDGELEIATDEAVEVLGLDREAEQVAVADENDPEGFAFGREPTLVNEADDGPRSWRGPRTAPVRSNPVEIMRHAYLTQMMATATDRRSASIGTRILDGDDYEVARWSLGREGRLGRHLQLR